MLDAASPLAGLTAPASPPTPGVTLHEVTGLSATMLHASLPGLPKMGRVAALPFGTALCTTPGQWLLLHPRGETPPGDPATRTPLHGGCMMLELTGPRAAELLATLLPIDLHPRAFGADAAAASVAAGIGVVIWRTGDGFGLCCQRSFALALAGALLTAGRGRSIALG